MFLSDERPENRNVKYTIVGDRLISSAEIWRFLDYAGGYLNSFETFIWEWDCEQKSKGKLLEQTYQSSEEECITVHDHMVKNLKNRKI